MRHGTGKPSGRNWSRKMIKWMTKLREMNNMNLIKFKINFKVRALLLHYVSMWGREGCKGKLKGFVHVPQEGAVLSLFPPLFLALILSMKNIDFTKHSGRKWVHSCVNTFAIWESVITDHSEKVRVSLNPWIPSDIKESVEKAGSIVEHLGPITTK